MGFTESKDKIGYRLLRAALPLEDVSEADAGRRISAPAECAEDLLAPARFAPSGGERL